MKIVSLKTFQIAISIALITLTSFSSPSSPSWNSVNEKPVNCSGSVYTTLLYYTGGYNARVKSTLNTTRRTSPPTSWDLPAGAYDISFSGFWVIYSIDLSIVCTANGTCPYANICATAYYTCDGSNLSATGCSSILVP